MIVQIQKAKSARDSDLKLVTTSGSEAVGEASLLKSLLQQCSVRQISGRGRRVICRKITGRKNMALCACGCGEEVRPGATWVRYHHSAAERRRVVAMLLEQPDLGAVPDLTIAKRLGVDVVTVRRRRKELGISASKPARSREWWAAVEGIGVDPDDVVAARLGLHRSVVWRARTRFGLGTPALVKQVREPRAGGGEVRHAM